MVGTSHFHGRGPGFDPWLKELISQKLNGAVKKKKKNRQGTDQIIFVVDMSDTVLIPKIHEEVSYICNSFFYTPFPPLTLA